MTATLRTPSACLAVISALLLAAPAAQAAPPAFHLMISTQGQGTDELADQAARELRDLVGIELQAAFPCAKVADDQDAESRLKAAKARVDRDPKAATSELDEVRDMINRANYVGVFSATRVGGRLQLRSRVYKHPDLHRSVDNVAIADAEDSDQLVTTLDQLAKLTARELATELGVKKCAIGNWRGTLSVTTALQRSATSDDGATQWSARSRLDCVLTGQGAAAKCTYSSSGKMSGGSCFTSKTASGSSNDAKVDVSIANGQLDLQVHGLMQEISEANCAATYPPRREPLAVRFAVPAGPDANSQSGSWTNPSSTMTQMGMSETVTWSLSRY